MPTQAKEKLLHTPSDLKEKDRAHLADVLNPLVADHFALYLKTKNYHWHMSGRHFRDYHLLLDEQADQIFAVIDPLAERVRKLGQRTIHSIGQVGSLQRVKDNDEAFVAPIDMLTDLLNENRTLAHNMREAHEDCENADDIATASLLEVFIDEAERRAWFLFETVQHID